MGHNYDYQTQFKNTYELGIRKEKEGFKTATDTYQFNTGDILRGIGKPEGLKYGYNGLWRRSITVADRLIYELEDHII
jgi:Txe/YoeB family toxin of Txe-Axe toxin-antitoxin module